MNFAIVNSRCFQEKQAPDLIRDGNRYSVRKHDKLRGGTEPGRSRTVPDAQAS